MTIEKTGKSERIDSHVHFWQPSRFEYHWLTPGSTLDRDWTPEMLSPQLQTAGVDGCIVMEATNREHEIEWLAALCDQHPFVRGAVGWVELRQPDAPHKLAAWTKTYPYAFKGVRLNMLTAQDCANPDALTPALHTLARFGLTCDVLLNEAFSEQVLHLVQAHPQVTFVLGHFAGATLARNRITQWADTVRPFADLPNVTLKLSSFVTISEEKPVQGDMLGEYLQRAIGLFGAHRLMFGSNYPVSELQSDYQTTIDIFSQASALLSNFDQSALFGQTARRVYRC